MSGSDITPFQAALRRHWLTVLIEGIVLLVLGALAIVVPPVATLAVAIFLGWLLLVGGVVGLTTTWMMRQAPGFTWSLISAILALIAGGILILWPGGAVVSLTYLMIAFFWIEGGVSILYALDHRRQLSGRWGWMLLSGIVDLVLGLIIAVGLPGSAAWAIGLLLGINLIFGGSALISMALAARAE
ncbi:MAG TPA: DUF308 domain-containing protein [Stellaceae bacterium]|jgi:uncharacterized membrane protein HdeD (DUF308 family)